jgi:N4-gp56 family major capsid protein
MANTYGSLSPRTAAYVVKELLDRGMPYLVFEKFGMAKPMPTKSTKTMQFRRYFLAGTAFTGGVYNPYEYYEDASARFDVTTVNSGSGNGRKLSEGVTPSAVDLDKLDISVSVDQYGMYTTITDVIEDTHEDNILQESIDILAESGAFLAEKIRYNALIGGTNVYYCTDNVTKSRGNVNQKINVNMLRLVVRGLKRNLGKPITKVVKSTAAYDTHAISPAYIAVCHTDLEADIRALEGFVPAEKYGTMTPFEGEIGKVESVRFVVSTVVSRIGNVGAAVIPTGILGSTNVTVYPILVFAADAYAVVPLKGKSSITPMVQNPNVPRGGDPLGQRGTVGIKFYHACKILQDAWMARIECACSSLV